MSNQASNQDQKEITAEEFRNWQETNVTRQVVEEVVLHLDLLKNHLANSRTHRRNAISV